MYRDEGPDAQDIERFSNETGYCPACGAEVWDQLEQCPQCGDYIIGGPVRKQRSDPQMRRRLWALVAVVTAVMVVPAGGLLFKWVASQSAGEPPVAAGVMPASLGLEDLLQSPQDRTLSWADLRGQVVVLDFWATWCVPCVRSIAHLNGLAEALQDEPVRFLAVTNEPRDRVEAFLEDHPMSAWVGLDTDGSMHVAYGIRSIPQTFVISGEGELVLSCHPAELTEEYLRSLLE